MRILLIAGFVGASVGVAAAYPAALGDIVDQVYPMDAARREALDRCSMAEQGFNRLDPTAREACYRRDPAILGANPAAEHAARNVNFVDLWREAGQGRLPQNDIRVGQRHIR